MDDIVTAKSVEGWNMSLLQLIGKSPSMEITCGKCLHVFSRRFDTSECRGRGPITICPGCGARNRVSISTY